MCTHNMLRILQHYVRTCGLTLTPSYVLFDTTSTKKIPNRNSDRKYEEHIPYIYTFFFFFLWFYFNSVIPTLLIRPGRWRKTYGCTFTHTTCITLLASTYEVQLRDFGHIHTYVTHNKKWGGSCWTASVQTCPCECLYCMHKRMYSVQGTIRRKKLLFFSIMRKRVKKEK